MSSEINKYVIGDACNVLTGFPFKGDEYTKLGTRVLRGENVTIGDLRWDTVKCWNQSFDEAEKYLLQEGDIVIGMDGSRVGKNRAQVRKEDLPLLLAQRVARLRANENFSQDYIAYVIRSDAFENYVDTIKTGTSIPHISAQQIKEFAFHAPNKEKQSQIARILSILDDKITLNRQTNTTLETIAQTIFKAWFVEFNFPGATGEMMESDLGEIPQGWQVGNLASICTITDYSANGSFAGLAENVVYKSEPDYAILIRLTDFNKDYQGDFVYIDKHAYDFLSKSKLIGGEVIIANVGANAGTVFRTPPLDKPMSLGPNALMIKPSMYNPYLFLFLSSATGQSLMESIKTGSAQPKFNKTDFRNLKILIPPQSIIHEFNSIYDAIDSILINNSSSNRTIAEIRDSLLSKLLNGEIEV